MEEYTFYSDNTTNENSDTPLYNTFPEGNAPKKKHGSAKNVILTLSALLLVICISVSSGLIGAYYMVENRIAELEDQYERIAAINTNDDPTGTDVVKNEKPERPKVNIDTDSEHFDSIAAAQSASAKAEQLAKLANKTANGGYAAVAAAVKDTVVEISTEMAAGSTYFQQFIQSGAGSGVIISDDGYIITNNHVIDGATKITVRLTSGDEYTAELIGTDAQADIAVIKIDVTNKLTYAIIGNSAGLLVGEEVLAIGNPLGELGGSVTNGIISALDRELTIDGQTMRLLQTNAAINPGNSGGGLFNMKGELVAIVNAKSSGTGIEGLGFAIPINYAYEIATELLTNGYVSGRPALGISYIEISNYMDLIRYGVNAYGIYVYDGGETPLQNGDRIISFGDYEVSDSATLKNAIGQFKVGDKVELLVARNGKFTKVFVTLIESKPEETSAPKLEINK
ncbi:MAG: trypsin-like serine protease [Ruminococcaceae bacterium]|nr:trypsin-like serine protease [Oscillospiraceae bacterium]